MKKTLGARLAALTGVAMVGLAGFAGPASAAEGPGNIDPGTPSSLTIHKYDGTPGTAGDGSLITDTSGLGNPLAGVTFTVTPVTEKKGTPATTINLDSAAGWDAIAGVTVADVKDPAQYTLGTPVTLTTNSMGTATESLPHGLYLVQETGYGSNPVKTPTPDFLVTLPLSQGNGTWLYEVHAYPKNEVDTDTPTKTASDPTDGVVVGSTVPWTITAPVQPNTPGAITSFIITDKLDTRLQYTSLSIAGFTEGDDYTVTTDTATNTVTITFTTPGLAKLKAGDKVVVTLNTKVLSIGDGAIPNQATVFTNDNGGKTTTKPTGPGNPTSNWGPLEILKYAAGDEAKTLKGAVFTVYKDAAATQTVGTLTTDETGKGSIVLFVGNDDDTTQTYYVKETTAPAGYLLDDTVRTVTVTAGAVASVVDYKIPNTPHDHPTLPLTGAAGTLIMALAGTGLVALGATSAIIARKRNN